MGAADLADSVLTGGVSLDKAYETARDRKRAAESTDSQMATLRGEAPDLADQVTEERLKLNEAVHCESGKLWLSLLTVWPFLPGLVITRLVVNPPN